jgi:hypothetical protein
VVTDEKVKVVREAVRSRWHGGEEAAGRPAMVTEAEEPPERYPEPYPEQYPEQYHTLYTALVHLGSGPGGSIMMENPGGTEKVE